MKIGLLHPGQMGVTVGAALLHNAHEVLWVPQGRSSASHQRAEGAGFTSCQSLAELVQASDAVISVCPPSAATEVASQVAQLGFAGLYLDANAIAPQTAVALGSGFADRYIDAGLIGPPALKSGTTRLYLSGPHAADAAAWFAEGALQAVAMDTPIGSASALKMSYAGYTKGLSALLLATQALAESYDVADWLAAEWGQSLPGTEDRVARAAAGSAPKAWRFAGEMREIAATYAAADLPSDFHQGAAQLYDRLAPLKDQTKLSTEQVMAILLPSDDAERQSTNPPNQRDTAEE